MKTTKGNVLQVARATMEYTALHQGIPQEGIGSQFFGAVQKAVETSDDVWALKLLDELLTQTDKSLARGEFARRNELLQAVCARVWTCLKRNGLREGRYQPYCPTMAEPVFVWDQETVRKGY